MVRSKVYGSELREFEAMLSKHFDNSHAITVSNATTGILGILYTFGIQNSEIITTPLTWPGALTPFKIFNNNIIYGTIEEPTLTLNPDTLESLITPNTKAVFSADFLGYPCRLDEISKICKKYNLLLIHDAASSMGATYRNKYSGYYADVTVYSFGRNKPFTTGEGGVILTNNESYYENLIMNITHPERQDIELDNYNPLTLNTSLNPLAVSYGLRTFDEQLKKIYVNRKMVSNFILENQFKIIHSTVANEVKPNYYKPFFKLNNFKNSLVSNLPFKPLSNNIGINYNIFSSYKLLRDMCLIK